MTAEKTRTNGRAAESDSGLSPLLHLLRCIECGERVAVTYLTARAGYPDLGPDGRLRCEGCGEEYPLVAGTPRMLGRFERARLQLDYPLAPGAFQTPPQEASPRPATRS